ncbi:MAG: histidine phosphatase family protein [Pseudomonadota bacterium]
MKRLILMRHAKTEAWHEGIEDHGRALIERGRSDAVAMGEHLVRLGWRPANALVSTARRARETWRYAAPAWGGVEPTYEDDLYLAGPSTIEGVLAGIDWDGTVLLIGHNPGIHEFACSLSRSGGANDDFSLARLFEKFPTGCIALFDAGEDTQFHMSAFRLVDVVRPRDLKDEPDD